MRLRFTRFAAQDLFSAILALACVALVGWIRALPSTLPAANGLAQKVVEMRIREEIAPHIMSHFPAEQWADRLEAAVQEKLSENSAQFVAEQQRTVNEIKSELTFTGGDGRRYAYLGDYDSYVWLRNARNYLTTGTTCDAIVGGECRDTYGNAPVGYRMIYNRSLHIAAIVAAHRAMNFFRPGYPLPASAFLVPIILGALGALPAFFIARRVGGNTAAIVAAVTISLDPIYLVRSIGSDNDVWNVVMPLYIAWLLIAALSAHSAARAALFAAFAGVATGIYAAVWRGWIFACLVFLCAALGCFLLAALRRAAAGGWRSSLRSAGARAAAVSVVVYGLTSAVLGSLTAPSVFLVSPTASHTSQLWPSTFRTVAELSMPSPLAVAQRMGGPVFFSLAWLGLLALVVRHVKTRHIVIAAWLSGLFIVYYLLAAVYLPRVVFLLLFGAPLAAELVIAAWKNEPAAPDEAVTLLVLVWFFASLYLSFGGIRFLILFAAPFGFAVGAFADRLRAAIKMLSANSPARLASALTCAVALAVGFYPLQRGYAAAAAYYPQMNDAWWNTLREIKNRSTPNAIVNTWWDYGYWVKYFAERKVSSDGGALATHVPHWLAKSLLAPSDVETLGILRMLNCGSDATPLPEGRYGAMGKLVAMVGEYRAYGILVNIFRLDRGAAARYLANSGFSVAQQEAILASTHCRPAESFLVISGEMLADAKLWTRLGLWDVRRAYLARQTRRLREPEALRDLARLGYNAMEARALYANVAGLRTEANIDEFIAPRQQLISTDWVPCHDERGEMECDITVINTDGVARLEVFYDPAAPQNAWVRQGDRVGSVKALVIAGSRALDERVDSRAAFSDIGVLVDVAGERILVGSPLLIRSTLVRLFYLDGRYSSVFKPFSRKTTVAGEEVAAFTIDWND